MNKVKLGDIGTFARGKSKHRPRNDKKLYEGGGFPLVQTGDIKNSLLYIIEHTQEYNSIGLKQSKLWNKGTLAITIAANIAETAILSYPMCFPDSVVGFIADKTKTSELFVHYLLSYLRKNIQNNVQGTGSIQDNINLDFLEKFEVDLPDLPTQTAIAHILSSLDDKIELNNKINKELENLAKTIYEYWFVQNAEEKWERKSLYDIATFTNGLACQKFRPKGKNFYKVIKIREMRDGFTKDSELVDVNIPQKVIVNDGDILFSWSASLEVMIWTGGVGGLNQHIFKVTSDEYPKSFIYFQLLNYLNRFRIIAENRKTTMGHITIDHLKQSEIYIPP